MEYRELITDAGRFQQLRNECESVFARAQRLPERVFNAPYQRFYSFEHAQLYGSSFPLFLANLSSKFNDKSVRYMTFEPHPVDYYFSKLGFYGAASFEQSTLVDRYLKVMTRGGDVESFRARGGDVGALWGSSLQWGIFCDRVSWDICIVGTIDSIGSSSTPTIKFMDTTSLVRYVLAQYSGKPSVGEDFVRRFRMNFPNLEVPPAIG